MSNSMGSEHDKLVVKFGGKTLPTFLGAKGHIIPLKNRLNRTLTIIDTVIAKYRDEPWHWSVEEKKDSSGNLIRPKYGAPNETRKPANIPLYSSKFRVKDPYSLYLKAKRKLRGDLASFTDIGGMRLLVMPFGDSLVEVIEYVFHLVARGDFLLPDEEGMSYIKEVEILEANAFNIDVKYCEFLESSWVWVTHFSGKKVKQLGKENPEPVSIVLTHRGSGYQSFHLLLRVKTNDDVFVFEMQIRSLLQDVWSETEHFLAYKQGKNNDAIHVGFRHLQEDITTMENRLSHLHQVKREHDSLQKLSIDRSSPVEYLWYDDALLPKVMAPTQGRGLWSEIQSYKEKAKKLPATLSSLDVSKHSDPVKWKKGVIEDLIAQCDKIYTTAQRMPECKDSKEEQDKLAYWKAMELGYLYRLLNSNHEALSCYTSSNFPPSMKNNPVWRFRQGELYFVLGNDQETLKQFDECLELIWNRMDAGDAGKNPHVYMTNAIYMLTKIATTYDLIGSEEYVRLNILLCKKILSIQEALGSSQDLIETERAKSNLCWCLNLYLLDESDKEKRKRAHAEAYDLYVEIKENYEMGRISPTSNIMDTLAWFAFNTYLVFKYSPEERKKFGHPKDLLADDCYNQHAGTPEALLDTAKKLAKGILDYENTASFRAISMLNQTRRVQKILTT